MVADQRLSAGPAAAPDDDDLAWTRSVRRRRVPVPSILQLEAVECGAAALAMILARNGAWVPSEELRVACGVSRDGANALNIVRAARRYGLDAHGFHRELRELPDEPFPVIAFWGFNHFVVVEGVSRRGLLLNDPAVGRRIAGWDEADARFTGLTLHLRPDEDFRPRGRPPSALRVLLPLASGSWSGVVFGVLAGIALLLPALAIPVAVQLLVDQAVPTGDDRWTAVVLAVVIAAAALQWWFLHLQQIVLLRFNLTLGLSLGDELVGRALRLPPSFFDQRYAGDVAYRVSLAGQIAAAISGQLAPALLALLTSAVYLAVLAALSLPLAGIALLGGAADALAVWLSGRRRIERSMRATQELAVFNGAVAYGLQTMETVKATGSEADLLASITGTHARTISAWGAFQRPTIVLASAPRFIGQVTMLALLAVGVLQAIDGDLAAGSLLAATVALTGFLGPIGTVVTLAATLQQLRAGLIRIQDVLDQPEDPVLRRPAGGRQSPGGTLRGEVELRGVTFGYNRAGAPLIRDLDLRLAPGARVAVVGASGSGKSTIARLVSGLVQPWSGEILLDGEPYASWPREVVTSSLAMVDQEIVLFAASIRENLTLWDRTVPDEDVVAAARDAAIHDQIVARAGAYDAEVTEAADNWSGGERQRMEIARALTGRPSVLILDEATSALDPLVEHRIDQALRRRGMTTLIVAHRLSTIRDADEILVLHRGRVVERGRHDELVALDGRYARIARNG